MDVDLQAGTGGSNVVIKTAHPRVRMVTRSRDGSGNVTTEVWSPERVVLEQRLRPQRSEAMPNGI